MAPGHESIMLHRTMSIWTRIAYAIGDSITAFLSRVVNTRAEPEKSIAFTIGVIALGAKMAKADGIVTGEEVTAFRQVFHVPDAELAGVARVFNLAKQDVTGYDTYARQLSRLFAEQPQMLEDLLDSLFHIAKADGAVHERELTFLENVASIFGFSKANFSCIKARHVIASRSDPYIVLGIAPAATNEEIRQHYRKLVRDNHPDRHIAAGVPEEMIEVATEKLASINAAYDAVARERGL